MKKTILLLAILHFFSFSIMATDPVLSIKDLSTSPAIGATRINYAIGTRKITNNTSFAPTSDYTVEVKAKILSAAVKGFILETRDNSRNGIRLSINSSGIDNYGALNYTNETAITNLSAVANDAATFHIFRFAVQGSNVHIYRDGVFVTTTTTQGIYNDNLLKDNNGNFESADMSMWNFILVGQGRTTTAGEMRTGSGAVKIKNTNNSSVVSSLTIKGLKPSTTYSFSFYAKYTAKGAASGNMRYSLKLGNYGGSLGAFVQTNAADVYNNIYGAPNASTDPLLAVWTAHGKQFTTGASDSIAILDIMGWNSTNTIVIDDMVLYEAEVTPTVGAAVGSNLLTNGTFAADISGWSSTVSWPFGLIAWSSNGGGQLQVTEANWAGSSNGTYTTPVTVLPNKAYKLTATTTHQNAATQSVTLTDGLVSASTSYSAAGAYAVNNITTPAFYTSPSTNSLSMQFTTKTGHRIPGQVSMTLDNVLLSEYAATYPTYLSYGKAFQSEAANFDISYINYDMSGAYAPLNYVIAASSSGNGSVSGAATYTSGATVSLTAAPNSGYSFVNWTDGGSPVSTSATFSFTASAGRTLVANFAAVSVTVTGILSSFSTTYGTASAEQSFTVAGSNLSSDIIVTPPSGFEVSLTSGLGYLSSVILTQSSGTVATTPIYVRLKSTAPAATYSAANITINTTGSSQNLSCSGTVAKKALNFSIASTVANKTYNGNNVATVTIGTLTGFVGSETVTATATGTFSTVNVGSNYTATIVYTLIDGTNGGLATNYSLANGTALGTISSKQLSNLTVAAQSVTYGTPAATVLTTGSYTALTGFVNGETAATALSGTATYTTNYTNTTAAGTAGITIGYNNGLTIINGNYWMNKIAGTITITKATPTISVSGIQSFTYNNTAQGPATISYNGDGTTSLQYTSTDGGGYSSAIAPTNAGAYQVVASAAAGTNFNAASSSAYAFTILSPPTVSSNTNVSNLTLSPSADLTVAAGATLVIDQSTTVNSVTVVPGANLTVNSNSALNVAGGITLQNTASGTASFVDSRAIDSPTAIAGTVQQDITESNRNWYVSIPVTGKQASDITLTGARIVKRNEAAASWDEVTGSLTAGVGYIAVGSATGGTTTWTLAGNLNSGKVEVPVTHSGASSIGFNLLGNPYPSYLNWEEVLNQNATNASLLQPTIWYRTAVYNNGLSKFDYSFNTYNSAGRVATPTSTTGYIPPMQAFWVRANSAGTVTFTNAMRSHGNGASNKLKAPSANKAIQQVLRLQVSNGINTDETVIYTNPNASNGYDMYDSPKMSNNNAAIPEIFTRVGSEQLVINGLNSISLDQEILLGLTQGTSSQLSIKATELSNFDSGTQLILRDYLDPNNVVEQDLTNGVAYSFVPTTNAANRFSLVFKVPSVTTGIISADNESDISIFRNGNGQITVSCPTEITGKAIMSIYNAVGQKLENQVLNNTLTVVTTKTVVGVYVVNVAANGKVITRKVIIN